MKLVVMKFGGTSVANSEKIKNVARRIIQNKKKGYRVVVVVSAPGKMTDDLIGMAGGVTAEPDEREMDVLLSTGEQVSIALLSMAIKEQGHEAISLTGPQAGIKATVHHTRAKITRILPQKLSDKLKEGKIVIVAGFQGINTNLDIVTLGRGGSDLTAVALAAVLKADLCEIYTDVDGIYTADPRVCPNSRKIDKISYDEILELAGSGAQVMQARSIEVAKKFNVNIHVRSSYKEIEGTRITREVSRMEDVVVSGIAFDRNQVKMSVSEVVDRPGVAARIFGALAKGHVNVDMIIQSAASGMNNDISFTISKGDLNKALKILEEVKRAVKARKITYDDNVSKVAIVGVGMRSHPGVAANMFKAFAANGINIEMISTSEIKISCIVNRVDLDKAVKVLNRVFKLGKKK